MKTGIWALVVCAAVLATGVLPMGGLADGPATEAYCGDLVIAGQGALECTTSPPIVLPEDSGSNERLQIQAISYPPLAQLGLYGIEGKLLKNGIIQRTYDWPCDSSLVGGTSGGSCYHSYPDSGKIGAGSYQVRATYEGAPAGVETWAWGVAICRGPAGDGGCLGKPHAQSWCRELLDAAGDPNSAASCAASP